MIVCRNVHHHDGRSCPRVCAQVCERELLLSAVAWSDWHCRKDKRATTKVQVRESTSIVYCMCICGKHTTHSRITLNSAVSTDIGVTQIEKHRSTSMNAITAPTCTQNIACVGGALEEPPWE